MNAFFAWLKTFLWSDWKYFDSERCPSCGFPNLRRRTKRDWEQIGCPCGYRKKQKVEG